MMWARYPCVDGHPVLQDHEDGSLTQRQLQLALDSSTSDPLSLAGKGSPGVLLQVHRHSHSSDRHRALQAFCVPATASPHMRQGHCVPFPGLLAVLHHVGQSGALLTSLFSRVHCTVENPVEESTFMKFLAFVLCVLPMLVGACCPEAPAF